MSDIPAIQASIYGFAIENLVLNAGPFPCATSSALLEKLNSTTPSTDFGVTYLDHPITIELDDGTPRYCTQYLTIPSLKLLIHKDKTVTITDLSCLLMDETDDEELIIGNEVFLHIFGIKVVDLLQHLETSIVYDGRELDSLWI